MCLTQIGGGFYQKLLGIPPRKPGIWEDEWLICMVNIGELYEVGTATFLVILRWTATE